MKIVCANKGCDETDKRFITKAYVVEDCLIDSKGNWLRSLDSSEIWEIIIHDARCQCGSGVEVTNV